MTTQWSSPLIDGSTTHRLLDEVGNMLSEARSEILGAGKANRPKQRRQGCAQRD
jgi:hypothetical protein